MKYLIKLDLSVDEKKIQIDLYHKTAHFIHVFHFLFHSLDVHSF